MVTVASFSISNGNMMLLTSMLVTDVGNRVCIDDKFEMLATDQKHLDTGFNGSPAKNTDLKTPPAVIFPFLSQDKHRWS